MKIREVMSHNPATIKLGTSMRDAAVLLQRSQASDLMVVEDDNTFVGVLSEGDIVRAVMPRFEDMLLSSGNLYELFGMFLEKGQEIAQRTIDGLVIHDADTMDPEQDAVKAAAAMVSKQIRRLPVVEDGRLIGAISRADIVVAVVGD
jgi:CBS domain-containing protein